MSTLLWNLNSVVLRGSTRPRLDHVSCSIPSGITAILGSSGAGKTSLLNVLAGLETPDSGSLEPRLEARSGELPLYWAPQGGGLWPHLTVQQHLTEVGKDRESADKLLTQFDLQDRRAAFPEQLSQGERARLSVARALSVSARVLLFDEPLVHVDGEHKAAGWRMIRRLHQESGNHLVLTTHEPDVVLREAETVLCLTHGRLVWSGPVRQLYTNPPDESVGRFLGPLNWFTSEQQHRWLRPEDRREGPRCLRPEQLQLQSTPAGDSVCEVVDSVFTGQQAETTLRHPSAAQTMTVIHRPAAALVTGERVTLKVRTDGAAAGGADA